MLWHILKTELPVDTSRNGLLFGPHYLGQILPARGLSLEIQTGMIRRFININLTSASRPPRFRALPGEHRKAYSNRPEADFVMSMTVLGTGPGTRTTKRVSTPSAKGTVTQKYRFVLGKDIFC